MKLIWGNRNRENSENTFRTIGFVISTISFLPFSGRPHKMTHKGWCVIKLGLQWYTHLTIRCISRYLLHDTCHNTLFTFEIISNGMWIILWWSTKVLTILQSLFGRTAFNWLFWGLTTHQLFWVISCRLPEKGRKEIEEMKERDREERGTGIKVKKQKKEKHSPSTLTCYKDSRPCPTVSQYKLDASVTRLSVSGEWICTILVNRLED